MLTFAQRVEKSWYGPLIHGSSWDDFIDLSHQLPSADQEEVLYALGLAALETALSLLDDDQHSLLLTKLSQPETQTGVLNWISTYHQKSDLHIAESLERTRLFLSTSLQTRKENRG